MSGDGGAILRVYEDEHFTAEQCAGCAVPGYLIVRLEGPATSLAALGSEEAARLGAVLARAERVYCLAFAEVDPRLHFHLFPRTRAVLAAYRAATGTGSEPVNGPRLFEWARTEIVPGRPLPSGIGEVGPVCARIRRALSGGAAPGR